MATMIDFADPLAAKELFAGAGYTALVNNAGIIRREDAVTHSEADVDAVIDTNLKAVFFTCQAFGRELIAQGAPGAIVNIASLLSFPGGIQGPGYTASKHGVAGITQLLANEWAPHGITVNATAPGYIATSNTEALREDPERSHQILERIPAGRWGGPRGYWRHRGLPGFARRALCDRRGSERPRRRAGTIGRAPAAVHETAQSFRGRLAASASP